MIRNRTVLPDTGTIPMPVELPNESFAARRLPEHGLAGQPPSHGRGNLVHPRGGRRDMALGPRAGRGDPPRARPLPDDSGRRLVPVPGRRRRRALDVRGHHAAHGPADPTTSGSRSPHAGRFRSDTPTREMPGREAAPAFHRMLDMLRGLEAELIRAPRDLDLEGRVRIVMRDSLRSTSRGDSPADSHPRLWPDWPSAQVAPLPPRGSRRTGTFSMPITETFSVPIDTTHCRHANHRLRVDSRDSRQSTPQIRLS